MGRFSPAAPRRRWARIWLASFLMLAALAPVLAWWSSRDPAVAGRATALRDAEALEGALRARGRAWREDLLEQQRLGRATDPPALAEVRWSEDGDLTTPRALPAGVELLDEADPADPGGFSPARSWLLQAQQRVGDPAAVRAACQEGMAVARVAERATRARLQLAGAQAAARGAAWGDAVALLIALRESTPATAWLDGRSLFLLTSHRLADAMEAGGDPAAARLERELLRRRLLALELPLAAAELERELRFLREGLDPGGEGASAMEEEAVVRSAEWAEALGMALRADPARSGVVLPGAALALLDAEARRGAVFDAVELERALATAWGEVLPTDGSWQVLTAAATPADAATMGAVAAPPGMAGAWRLVLTSPEGYAAAFARRQTLLWSAAWLVAAAFAGVAWLGRRALLRQAELERLRIEFISGVSHELRTPAASLALLADNLAEGRVSGAERQAEYHAAMRRDAHRLQRLVADVLDASRLERGAFRVEPMVQESAPLLRRGAEEQRARLADAGLELRLELAEPLPRAPLDADAIERALANLLENARKYAAGGGSVTLRARGAEGRLRIEVEDRGPGVPEEWRERVFEPFERVPDGRPLSAGAGLGLALVRATARAHGGAAWVEAGAGGGGARFVLELPAAREEGGGMGGQP